MSKELYVMKSQLLGVFAKYAVSQSPYDCPDNLELVISELSKGIDSQFKNAPLGVAKFPNWQTLEEILGLVLATIPEYVAWNDRKNGNDAPLHFTSRYDTGSNPDDDFIDLDALQRNVVTEIDRDQA
ncbi:MAG: hypothetical protein JWL86_6963 [Rhizobium sp.]|nr:hypothetical protein [Rhizobium sp.]